MTLRGVEQPSAKKGVNKVIALIQKMLEHGIEMGVKGKASLSSDSPFPIYSHIILVSMLTPHHLVSFSNGVVSAVDSFIDPEQ